MPLTIDRICQYLSELAPLALAESWDNVGLLVGDRSRPITSVMTCLTISPAVADEAIEEGAGMIVTHHPLPFRPLSRITTDNVTGKLLLDLIGAGVAIYSAHTAFDSAARGINQRIAEGLGLSAIAPLEPYKTPTGTTPPPRLEGLGAGRKGHLHEPRPASEVARRAIDFTRSTLPTLIGAPDRPVKKVAIACGSGGSFLDAARRQGCDMLITGESNYHGCLEAESTGVSLLLLGHFASERFGMEAMAEDLASEFPELRCWASQRETDPTPETFPL